MLDFLLGNDFLSAIIAFVLVLIPAVIIHELGHFLAAKAVGITVLEFGIGFPPRAAKLFNWGETEFTLNWLPLGGFVRPLGEDMIRPLSDEEVAREREKLLDRMEKDPGTGERALDPEPENQSQTQYLTEREELAKRGITDVRSINEVKPWPRIFFMSAGALANFVSAFLLFVLVGLIGLPQSFAARVYLPEVPTNSVLGQLGFESDDYIEAVDGETFDTSREFFELLVARDGDSTEVTLFRDDESQTITVVPDSSALQSLINARGQIEVVSVIAESPAEEAGLQDGDIIIAYGDTDLTTDDDPFATLQGISETNEGIATPIVVIRDDDRLSLTVTPRVNPAPGEGHMGVVPNPSFFDTETGFQYIDGPDQQRYEPLPFGESVAYGVQSMNEILVSIVELPGRLLRSEAEPEEGRIISIVAVSQLGGAFLQESIQQNQPVLLLRYIAIISIALGITNLLPIPALDGGRILFVLIEIVRGRPISPEREGIIHLIGLAFLLSIGVLFIINDIINPVTNLLP